MVSRQRGAGQTVSRSHPGQGRDGRDVASAFVLSGGASLGAVQVGMLRALGQYGVRPDVVVGTSVGAVNGAFVAGWPGPAGIDALERIWSGITRADVFPTAPLAGLLGFVGRRDHLVRPDALRSLLRRHLSFERIEHAATPFRAVATEVTTGEEVVLDHGDAVDAVAASAAIPGVFPPVHIDGRWLMDGAAANNTPLSCSVDWGADDIWVLSTGTPCALVDPPRGALGMALQAVSVLVAQRLARDLERYHDRCHLRVVPPLCPLAVSPVDFSHTAELIERAHRSTLRWLEAGAWSPDPAAVVTPHSHV
jgi:NTE family protein